MIDSYYTQIITGAQIRARFIALMNRTLVQDTFLSRKLYIWRIDALFIIVQTLRCMQGNGIINYTIQTVHHKIYHSLTSH